MAAAGAKSEVVICPDAAALAAAAAERIIAAAQLAISKSGRFTIALSGGSTPERTYKLLAQAYKSRIDWSHTWLLFSDERCVPHGDVRSNYHLANESLLKPGNISPRQVFSVPTDLGTPAQCAAAYETSLRRLFDFTVPVDSSRGGHNFPQIDLILLGLGDDGHTASLFPGKPALDENRKWITWSPPGTLPPPVDRVTFTFPLINAAREVMFLVSGAAKAGIAHEVIDGPVDIHKYPSTGVKPQQTLTWMLDQSAAAQLQKRSQIQT
ncbi:MAG TPA: 6-phosphogluconolactonase [Pirellulales bacterium]